MKPQRTQGLVLLLKWSVKVKVEETYASLFGVSRQLFGYAFARHVDEIVQ